MRKIQGIEDFLHDVNGDFCGHPHPAMGTLSEQGQYIEPVYVLHYDKELPVFCPQFEGLGNLWVGQLGGKLRFGDEHLCELLIRRQVGKDPLDHHRLFETVGSRYLG